MHQEFRKQQEPKWDIILIRSYRRRKQRVLGREKKLCGPLALTSPCLDTSPQQRPDLQMQLLQKSYFSLQAQVLSNAGSVTKDGKKSRALFLDVSIRMRLGLENG